MSRRVYLEEQERSARQRAREARVASRSINFDDTANQHPNGSIPSEDDLMEVIEQGKAAIGRVWDTALIPFNAAISKPAQKAYLGTFLVAVTSLILLAVSTAAYALFYYNFVPQVSVERVIHLQFGDGNPYGTANLDSSLTSLQAYDVSLFLHLPRTPNNLAAGNFMLNLSLLSPAKGASTAETLQPTDSPASMRVLAQSRRPAILTYASPIIDAASTLTGLPWYVLGWKRESEVLEVGMLEGVEFPKGWTNVPRSVYVAVEADEKMQFYEVGVKIIARFGGIRADGRKQRWIMYHHRILSYVFFTSMFWTSSMISALGAWLILSSYFSTNTGKVKKQDEKQTAIKAEMEESSAMEPSTTDGVSDTSRTFPTLGRQMPLHFSRRVGEAEEVIKEEELVQSTGIQPLIAEADDEDDGESDMFRDSGIGTSLEEQHRAQVQRRRKALFGIRE